ncbi:unnamed protein product [Staurois parvus]|uniref:Uncharacterized protein n=1 Tax=Staurois parvus TaxID=386267 RepID=A0ABN9HP14_9NEOB|nr:unnamed protein product [Staurois parvus]
MALDSRAMQSSVLTVKHTHTQHTVKQHTVNLLIVPHVNPFLPSAISTESVLFISTDHYIGVTGDVSDTQSVPPSVRMPATVPLYVTDRCHY